MPRAHARAGLAAPRHGAGAGLVALSLWLGCWHALAAQEWRAAISAGDYVHARAELESLLRQNPDNTEWRYELARVLSYSGKPESALAEYETLLSRYPNNADYLLGQAQSLARLDRLSEALTATQRALELAPDYEDVWRLRLQLADRSGDSALAAATRAQLAQRYPNAGWWHGGPEPAEPRRWLTMGWGRDRLSNDAPSWDRQFLRLDWQAASAANYYGELVRSTRFGRSDFGLGFGGDWQALPRWRVGGGLSEVASADFEPRREIALAASRSLPQAWGAELRLRRREYAAQLVSLYTITADKYLSDYRIAYGLNYSRLHGAGSSLAHSLSFGWYPSAARGFAVTASTGEEVETIGLNRLLSTEVRGLTVSGRHELSQRTTLSWWLGTHRQGGYYRRRNAGFSLRIGF